MPNIKTILSSYLILISLFCFSQSEDLYNSNLISDELKTKSNAVVRYDKKTVEVLSYDKILIKKKRIVTIFNDNGNRHANSGEGYDNNTKIKKVEAHIYNANGEEIKKIKERDFTDASAVSNISIYEDNRVKYINYTPREYPYTIEYTSEVLHENTAFFPGWQPVDDYYVGIEHAEYEIVNTAGVEVKSKKKNFEDYNVEEISEYHFVVKNLKGISYEVYTPGLRSLTPSYRVAMKKFNMVGVDGVNTNWNDFGKWMYDRLLMGTDDIPQSTIDEVKQLTSGVENKIERAKMVYKYMQDKTRYISIQVGIGGWKPMLAKDVDKLGYADCKGLTNYTKALLEAVEVQSYYTLVYGGKSIRDIDNEFSTAQGNHAILCVPNNNENIFLECTSQTNPFGFTAGFTDDRDVLLVKPDGGEIVHTKVYEPDDSMQITKAVVSFDEMGSFTADVNIATTGFQYRLHEGIENEAYKDQELHYKEYWDNVNNIDIEEISLENDKNKIIYNETIKLSATNYASKSGNRLILQPNIFNKVSSIPPRYSERKLEFKIDRGFKDVDEFIIQLPENLLIEAMSDGKTINSKFGKYQFMMEAIDGNKIKYSRTYILNKGNYEKEDYQSYRDFTKKIVKYDKSKIVLVKV